MCVCTDLGNAQTLTKLILFSDFMVARLRQWSCRLAGYGIGGKLYRYRASRIEVVMEGYENHLL